MEDSRFRKGLTLWLLLVLSVTVTWLMTQGMPAWWWPITLFNNFRASQPIWAIVVAIFVLILCILSGIMLIGADTLENLQSACFWFAITSFGVVQWVWDGVIAWLYRVLALYYPLQMVVLFLLAFAPFLIWTFCLESVWKLGLPNRITLWWLRRELRSDPSGQKFARQPAQEFNRHYEIVLKAMIAAEASALEHVLEITEADRKARRNLVPRLIELAQHREALAEHYDQHGLASRAVLLWEDNILLAIRVRHLANDCLDSDDSFATVSHCGQQIEHQSTAHVTALYQLVLQQNRDLSPLHGQLIGLRISLLSAKGEDALLQAAVQWQAVLPALSAGLTEREQAVFRPCLNSWLELLWQAGEFQAIIQLGEQILNANPAAGVRRDLLIATGRAWWEHARTLDETAAGDVSHPAEGYSAHAWKNALQSFVSAPYMPTLAALAPPIQASASYLRQQLSNWQRSLRQAVGSLDFAFFGHEVNWENVIDAFRQFYQLDAFAWRAIIGGVAIGSLIGLAVFSSIVFLDQLPAGKVINDFRLVDDYRDVPLARGVLAKDKVILGTNGGGLQVYSVGSGRMGAWRQITSDHSDLPGDVIESLVLDGDRLLVASGSGLSWADTDLYQWHTVIGAQGFAPLDVSKDISVVTLDDHWLAVGTNENGLGVYDVITHQWRAFNLANEGLFSNKVYDIAADSGYLWVATDSGLNVFELSTLKRHTCLEITGVSVRHVTLADRVALIATLNGGARALTWQGDCQATWTTLIGDTQPRTGGLDTGHLDDVMLFDNDLWVAERDGVFRYDTAIHDWSVSLSLGTGGANELLSYNGTLWAATSGGIYRFDPASSEWTRELETTGDEVVHLKEYNGDLWYTTSYGSLGVYSSGAWHTLIGSGIPGAGVPRFTTLVSYDGLLWLGTSHQGILVYDPVLHSWAERNTGLPDIRSGKISVVELKVLGTSLWLRIDDLHTVSAYQWRDQTWQRVDQPDSVRTIEYDGTDVWHLLEDGSLHTAAATYFDPINVGTLNDAAYVDSHLYFAANGIWRYETQTHNWVNIDSPTNTRRLSATNNRLWYVTDRGGLGSVALVSSASPVEALPGGSSITSQPVLLRTIEEFGGHNWLGGDNGQVYDYDPVAHTSKSQSRGLGGQVPLELRAIADSLLLRAVDMGTGIGTAYRFNTQSEIWEAVKSSPGDNVLQLAKAGGQIWLQTSARGIVPLSGSSPGFFKGSFTGLSSLADAVRDRFGRLWVVSPLDGVAVYTPETHQWETLSPNANVHTLQLVPGDSMDQIAVAGSARVQMYASRADGVELLTAQSLDRGMVQGLAASGGHLWALLLSPTPAIYSHQGDQWNSALGGTLLKGTDARIRAAAAFNDQLWIAGDDGLLASYAPATHSWTQSFAFTSGFTRLMVDGSQLWGVQPAEATQSIYRLSGQISALPQWVLDPGITQFIIAGYALWTVDGEGKVLIHPAAGGPIQVVIGDRIHAPLLIQDAGDLAKQSPWLILLAGAGIVFALIIMVRALGRIVIRHGDLRRNLVKAGGSAVVLVVTIIAGFLIFVRPIIVQQQLNFYQSGERASALIAYQGDVWISTAQRIWRLRYDPASQEVMYIADYSAADGVAGMTVSRLVVVSDQLYASDSMGHLFLHFVADLVGNGHWETSSNPGLGGQRIAGEYWRWHPGDQGLILEVGGTEGQYRPVSLTNGMFVHEQARAIEVFNGALWVVSDAGIASYSFDADSGKLSLRRLYTSQDGLPEAGVQRCLAAEGRLVCETEGQVLSLENDHWQVDTGPSPFDSAQTVYEDAQTGLRVERGAWGARLTPATMATNTGFIFDQIQQMYEANGRLWLETPGGTWQAGSDGAALSLQAFYPAASSSIPQPEPLTWTEEGWIWTRTQTCEGDVVAIRRASDISIARTFDASGTFADLFAQDVMVAGNSMWIATRAGVWSASVNGVAVQPDILYPVGNVVGLLNLDGRLYAQRNDGAVLEYNNGQWDTTSGGVFETPLPIFSEPATGLTVERRGTELLVNLLQGGNGAYHFDFDQIQKIVAQPGYLWAATGAGIAQYRTDNFQLIRRYTMADGLLSNRILNVAVDETGAIYSSADIPGGNGYQVLINGNWEKVAQDDTPFRQSRHRINGTLGIADWYQENGTIQPELAGQPVPFVNGKLAFDYTSDVAVNGQNLWLATAYGPLQYRYADGSLEFQNLDSVGEPLTAIDVQNGLVSRTTNGTIFRWENGEWTAASSVSLQTYPFVRRVVSFDSGQWQSAEVPDRLVDSPFRVTGIPDSLLWKNGRFSFDNVQSIVMSDGFFWLGTDGGVARIGKDGSYSLFTTQHGLPGLNITSITAQQGQIFAMAEANPVEYTSSGLWHPAAAYPSTVERLVLSQGKWQRQVVPFDSPAPFLAVEGSSGPVFASNGKFAIDSVHGLLVEGARWWLATEGGLLQAHYSAGEGVVIEELTQPDLDVRDVRRNPQGQLWISSMSADGNRHIALDGLPGVDPFQFLHQVNNNISVDVTSGTGMALEINGQQESFTCDRFAHIVSVMSDDRHLWIVTPDNLISLDITRGELPPPTAVCG